MKKAHRLIIDLGNSRVKYQLDKTYFNIDDLPDFVFDVFIVSSVPSKNQAVIDELEFKRKINSIEIFDPEKQDILTGIYQGIGADRVAKLIGALELNPGKNIILMDFGTATTISVANQQKKFLGGFITLGLRASLRALSEECEGLADFSNDLCDYDFNAVREFNSTKAAILYGTYTAHLGLINEWIFQASKLLDGDNSDLDSKSTITVCTGGDAVEFERYFDKHLDDGELLFKWLKTHDKSRIIVPN